MKGFPKVDIAIFAVAVLLLLTWSRFPDGAKFPMHGYPEHPQSEILILNAQRLSQEFAEDAAAARKKYSGQNRVWVKGRVTAISGPSIILEGNPTVDCHYMTILEQARVRMGQEIMIEGWVKGEKDYVTVFRPCK